MSTDDVTATIQQARSRQRLLLTEVEAKTLLDAAGVKVARARLAWTREESVRLAREIGLPVVLKICSPDVVHKSDLGGVKLNLRSEDEVGEAFEAIMAAVRQGHPSAVVDGVSVQAMAKPGVEVILGLTTDPQFGPILMFGLGGV